MATIAKPTLTRSCFAFLLGVLGCGIYLFGWTTTVDAASYSETIQADNPLAWWRLGDDAGSNTVAEQIAGYSGTVGQDVTLGTAGAPSGEATLGKLSRRLTLPPAGDLRRRST